MKRFIICLAIVAMATTVYAELSFEKVFEAKFGNITFNHLSHVDADCVACHGAINENEGMDKAFGHGFCKDCHKANEGPTKCKECHIK